MFEGVPSEQVQWYNSPGGLNTEGGERLFKSDGLIGLKGTSM